MKKIDRAAAAYQKSGFLKTSTKTELISSDKIQDKGQGKSSEETTSGYSKAAKFLLLVGPDQAAEVLKQFSTEDVEKIAKEIALVRKLDKGESDTILNEFSKLKKGKDSKWIPSANETIAGGPKKAREMLCSAFGNEKGSELFNRALPFGGRKPFNFLDELHSDQILMILKNEPPYVMSIVLSFLKPEISSGIIADLPAESRKEIVLRIARQGEVAPGIIEKMEGVFRDRIRAQGTLITEEIDGKNILAEILKHMDLRSEENILDDLSDANTELSEQIKDSIYTIDLIMKMNDKDLQYLLRDFDDSELAVIIKGKKENIRNRLLDGISLRRKETVEEESLHLGEMLRSDVDKATRDLINYLMDLEQKGLVQIPRGKDEWI